MTPLLSTRLDTKSMDSNSMIQSTIDRELIDLMEDMTLFAGEFCPTSLPPALTTLSTTKDILLSHKNHSAASVVIVPMAAEF